jgi:CRISPR/Cas system-associated exonuclease Cas4 (RecB family)
MAFRPSTYNLGRFNSAASSELLSLYQNFVVQKIIDDKKEKPEEVFRPSSFRCDRMCWFRIRGVEPDTIQNPDPVLQFKANLGTACHEVIQQNMIEVLDKNWIDPEEYLKHNPVSWKGKELQFTFERKGLETRIKVADPPFQFSCDGIIHWNDKLHLFEIKTIEFSSFEELTDPREDHIDQVKCYATLLNLSSVLFIYQERSYGGIKCYELQITDIDKKNVMEKVERIMLMKEQNLAPDKLPSGDILCSNCQYKKKCREWG